MEPMKTIDCRNMACPAPVVTTKRALEQASGEALQVLVDDGAPRENVGRFARNRGFIVEEKMCDDGYALTISPTEEAAKVTSPAIGASTGERVLIIGSDRLGEGPEELGRLLMKNFIITLLDLETLPDRILFLNSGVHLTVAGSEVLEALEHLGNRGVEILSCGICLDYFGKKDKLKAGAVTNMFTTAESILNSSLAVTF
jgi:selenium metabolism protein YedF